MSLATGTACPPAAREAPLPGRAGPDSVAAAREKDYRRAAGRFAAGVTVITVAHPEGPRALTASSFTSVSLDPILVLICVARAGRFGALLQASDRWAVSVLADDQEDLARRFGRKGREQSCDLIGVETRPGPYTGAPLLSGAIATFECRTAKLWDGGDHMVLLGEVRDFGIPRPEAGPLIFHGGCYRRLPAQLPGSRDEGGPGAQP